MVFKIIHIIYHDINRTSSLIVYPECVVLLNLIMVKVLQQKHV